MNTNSEINYLFISTTQGFLTIDWEASEFINNDLDYFTTQKLIIFRLIKIETYIQENLKDIYDNFPKHFPLKFLAIYLAYKQEIKFLKFVRETIKLVQDEDSTVMIKYHYLQLLKSKKQTIWIK